LGTFPKFPASIAVIGIEQETPKEAMRLRGREKRTLDGLPFPLPGNSSSREEPGDSGFH
jgi:hypothetical protein